MKNINKVIVAIIALIVAFTAVEAVGQYIFISWGYYIYSAVIGILYPIGVAIGIATIKYELED